MANKYRFGRDCITVNGQTFPARYEVMERDAARDSFFTVVIMATVGGGQEVRIEVPASDKQHGAALAAAQLEAGTLADVDPAAAQGGQQDAPTVPADVAPAAMQDGQQDNTQAETVAATDSTQTAPEAAQIEKEAQTMKKDNKRFYEAYFTDYPTQAVTIQAANKKEAEKVAQQYIRQWGLNAKIDRVECVPPLERREGQTRPEYRQDGQQDAPTIPADVAPVAEQDGQQASSTAPADVDPAAAQGGQQDAPTVPADVAPAAAQDGQQDAPTIPADVAPAAAQDGQQDAPTAPADPKATRGPVPEKTFINEVIAGKGWSIVFDAGCNRTRVIIAEPVKAAARPIVEAAGFYYSRQLDSWNKKLTFRAYRAANALADKLRAALA